MELEKIKEVALANGFSLKEQASGNMDLHSYVYEFANALLKEATPEGFVLVPKKLSDEMNDHLWDFMTDNFISTNEDGDSYIACDDFDLGKFYSEIIEAQEQSHD
ncbi:hypothetical protein ACG95N_09445 [Acinetobacter guillouiae]|uniref:hypothetical protein n=1 Tax=Acinetobacter guillouiae TaxID=106649 RepID=UPI003AF895BC